MQNSKVNVAAVLMAAALCLTHAVPGWSEPVENKRKVYVGTMVAVPLAQDLHHQTSFTVLDNELTASGDLAIGYGLGFAAVVGRGISDYAALELTGSWSKQSSVLGVSLPAVLQGFSSGDFELPAGFSYDGKLVSLQSKIDLLVYPTKMAMTPGDGVKPYLGGGVGIVRPNMDMDIERDEPTQAFIETLEELGFAELLPEKIDDRGTDLQLTLRAGVNVPFNEMDLDLGWQFYRTYIEGENNSSHIASGSLKYAF